jgi:CRISPR-associated protein Csd1
MILQALYELSERERLMEDPDFEPKLVTWVVRLSPEGHLIHIERADIMRSVPRQPTGRAGTKAPACFLVDNTKYVFGLPTKNKTFAPEEGREKAALFRSLVAEAARETGDVAAKAVFRFLEDLEANRIKVELDEKCKPNDLFAFIVSPDADQFVHERLAIKEFWRRKRCGDADQEAKGSACLVSGRPVKGNQLFPLIRGVPGKGTSTGVALVSFNKNAFTSYGWERNANAPISREAAEACSTALNRLLHRAYPLPSGRTLPRQNVQISADTVVCYWTKRESDFSSVFAGILEGNPEEVGEQYRSVWRGKLAEISDPTAFYALTLSGSQGRAIVRDWFESTVQAVAHNLNQHFADLEIVRNAKSPRGAGEPPCFPLGVLLESLAANGKREEIPPAHAAAIVRAALQGIPYPLSILQRAVERQRAEIGRDTWTDFTRRDARAALIKAVLNRRRRSRAALNYEEVSSTMDPSVASQGYVLGRLLAVLERLQQEAQGEVNATVIDRYFSGASASPKSVFVRLLKNTRHHVSKIKGEGSKYGLALRLEKIVDETAERFDPKHNGFPAYLDLEQQGLFILGYHQMRHWLWLSKEERDAWQRAYPSAPRPYLWNSSNDSRTEEEKR